MEIITRNPFRSSLLLIVAVAALALAACGGGDNSSPSSSGPDPATLTPADAVFYGDATIKPEGDQKSNVESALQKLTGSNDIGGMIGDSTLRSPPKRLFHQ